MLAHQGSTIRSGPDNFAHFEVKASGPSVQKIGAPDEKLAPPGMISGVHPDAPDGFLVHLSGNPTGNSRDHQ